MRNFRRRLHESLKDKFIETTEIVEDDFYKTRISITVTNNNGFYSSEEVTILKVLSNTDKLLKLRTNKGNNYTFRIDGLKDIRILENGFLYVYKDGLNVILSLL